MTRFSNRKRPYDYDEPYKPLPRPKGGSTFPTSNHDGAQGWWVGGEWIEAPASKSSQRKQSGRLSPIVIKDDDDSDCKGVPPPVPQKAKSTRATQGSHFDFNNSTQDVPWAAKADASARYEPRSFAHTADDELLSYLADRLISTSFLVEIDQFLRSHPEIADCHEGRETITHLNSVSPLEGYKYFLRGYTRPARYIDGIIKSDYFTLPANFPYQPLSAKVDSELVDFFEGFEYRWDIIERIDKAVRSCIYELSHGRPLSSSYRRLVCYAVWGNPSDAYKWYEYQLQEDYLPHRYLPEHVVLGHLPKLLGEADPQPSSLNTSGRHKDVRYRMARANDAGIDVLEVLMAEFKSALIRKGFRRGDIVSMCARAKDRLENERRNPTGADIVDFIMDEVPTERPARRIYARQTQYTQPVPSHSRLNTMSTLAGRRRKKNKFRTQNVPAGLRTQASALRLAKANLERAYVQERNVNSLSYRFTGIAIDLPQVQEARARAERRYVNSLICYGRNSNQMSVVQATELQAAFTCRKMQESGVSNAAYLLGMYPREL